MSNIKPDPKWPAISDPAPTAAPAKFPYDHGSLAEADRRAAEAMRDAWSGGRECPADGP